MRGSGKKLTKREPRRDQKKNGLSVHMQVAARVGSGISGGVIKPTEPGAAHVRRRPRGRAASSSYRGAIIGRAREFTRRAGGAAAAADRRARARAARRSRTSRGTASR